MAEKKLESSGDTGEGGNDANGDARGDGGKNDPNDKGTVSAVDQYTQSASVHGIKYVLAGDRSVCTRIAWGLFFLGMFCALMVTLGIQLEKMSEYPILTKQVVVMEKELLFPAVTICNLNQFRKSYVQENILLQQLVSKMSDFSYLFDSINYTSSIQNDANKEYRYVMDKILDYAPHPLNDTLIECRWRNEQRPCSELFKTVVTDFGVCYSFNTRETETEQRKSDLFGNMFGLSVIMFTNQPEYVLSQWNMASGFRVLLHGFYQTPQMIENGFSVGPGSSYFGHITMQKLKFLPPPFKAFGDKECMDMTNGRMDGYLRYFPSYDLGACFIECKMNFTSKACGCKGMYDKRKFRANKTLRESCICPVTCKLQSYDVSLSNAAYPSQTFMENYNKILPPEERVDNEFYRNNYLELHLYYANQHAVNIEQFPQYTFESIMSTLGGQMGIFLGASLLSFVEFVEFIAWASMGLIAMVRKKVKKLSEGHAKS